MENNKTTGTTPAFTDLKSYLKTGSVLYQTGADMFGDSYGPLPSIVFRRCRHAAFATLSDVAPSTFLVAVLIAGPLSDGPARLLRYGGGGEHPDLP